jgi:hypothetical protein
MSTRKEYEMTEKDLEVLLDACKPTICIKVGNYVPATPQENANRAWQKLGEKMKFYHMSVLPSSKGDRFFTAIPKED